MAIWLFALVRELGEIWICFLCQAEESLFWGSLAILLGPFLLEGCF